MNRQHAPAVNGLSSPGPPSQPPEGVSGNEPFDRLTRLAARALKAPAAFLAVIRDGRESWKGAFGIPEALRPPPDGAPGSSFVQQLAAGEPLAIENALKDARFQRDPLVAQNKFPALLGLPLDTPLGTLPACLVVLDSRPRAWAPEETELLRDLVCSALLEVEVSRLREEVHREHREKMALLTSIPYGVFMLDTEGRITLLNPLAARFFGQVSGRNPDQLVGRLIWQECPEVADSAFARECRQAEVEGRPLQLETYFPDLRRWFAFDGIRSAEGLCVSFRDVTERTELEKSLRSQAEALTESNRGKEDFLVVLAHELRNALAPIRNALHLWGTGADPGDGEQARVMADREVQRISHLLEDLLKVSQVAPGSLHPNLERLDLGEVAAEAVRAALTSPEGRGQKLLVDLPADVLWVEGDRQMLEQLLVHLLNNATKFTRPGGQVWLEAIQEDAEVVLRVRDNGMGIPAEALPGVFDLFMRANRSEDRLRDGLGVGLTLVRRLVEAHGGHVEAHSEGSDRGSEFVVRLPVAGAASEALPTPPAESSARKSLQILIVENNKETAQSIAILLRAWGYEVRVTYDPFSALEEARVHPPRVILLDIGLPGMDGYEVAAKLREQSESCGAMLVAVTGYGEEEDRRRAREAGFDYHMVKPVDPNDLRTLLQLAETLDRPMPATT